MRKLSRTEYLAACVVAGALGLSLTACGSTTTVKEVSAAATSATKTVTAQPTEPTATTPAPAASAAAKPAPAATPVYIPSPVYIPVPAYTQTEPNTSYCGSPAYAGGVSVNADTSCPFAENVESAWEASGDGSVTAYSPVTGLDYTMYCSDTGTGYVLCTGGNNASVEFPGN